MFVLNFCGKGKQPNKEFGFIFEYGCYDVQCGIVSFYKKNKKKTSFALSTKDFTNKQNWEQFNSWCLATQASQGRWMAMKSLVLISSC